MIETPRIFRGVFLLNIIEGYILKIPYKRYFYLLFVIVNLIQENRVF